ncbi:hypothetical protein AD45P3_00260 [Alteromonas phage vB_AmaP_AD45-P3]|nr:hypothetical protein AD45P3_00260 [Alteromonas phage vB_AmaP_AD45-P3]
MNINEAVELIEDADEVGHVPLLIGVHGIGKSQAPKDYAKRNNMYFEPLILSLMDTGDMLGLPKEKTVGGLSSTNWSAPTWFTNIANAAWPQNFELVDLQFNDPDFQKTALQYMETEGVNRAALNEVYCKYYEVPNDRLRLLRQDNVTYKKAKRSLLNLDELNRAHKEILDAGLQLILDHRLHAHELPIVNGKETLIVGGVNPAGGDYSVGDFDPAFIDRILEAVVEPDLKTSIDYYRNINVEPVIIDFLQEHPSKLHFCPEDGSKGTSPRTWERVDQYLKAAKATKKSKERITRYLKSSLGTSVGIQFMAFYSDYASAFRYDDLVAELTDIVNNNPQLGKQAQADLISEKIASLESVKRMDFADSFIKNAFKEKPKTDPEVALVYFYALPLENLAAVLKALQTEDVATYAQLAKVDKQHNNKKLFMKLVGYSVDK